MLAWAIGAPERLSETVRELLEYPQNSLLVSPISIWEMSIKHQAGQFSQAHRDPFDRLLVAQAICEGVLLVSVDAVLDSFPVTRLW